MGRWWVAVPLIAGCGGGVHDVVFLPGLIPGTGTVVFLTHLDGDARVQLGVSGEGLDIASPTAPATNGAIPLLGLQTGKVYEFMVVVERDGKTFESNVIEAAIPAPARGIPPFTVDVSDPDRMCDPSGYILFSYLAEGTSGVAIINGDGNYVWTVGVDDPLQVSRVRPGRDGKSLLWNVADAAKADDVATVIRSSMDGFDRVVTRTLNGHHDFVELPDGRIAWLGYVFREHDAPEGEDLGVVTMAADVIYESDEGVAEVGSEATLFDTWEHYPAGVYTVPSDSVRPGPLPAFLPNAYEFGHGNSLVYRESDDAFFMMWRWLDTLIKVDRGNPADPYVWEMGGRFGDPALAVPPPGTEFEHAHLSDIWDGGMLVFDNRIKGDEGGDHSRLVEYTFTDSSRAQSWQYESDEHEEILGDARRIPVEGCENVLVSWSGRAQLSEITPDGDVVWHASSAVARAVARVTWLPDLYDFSGVAYPP